MGIVVIFWDKDNKNVETRYFDSSFLATESPDKDRNFYAEIFKPNAENRETKEFAPLLDIGTCGLHTVHIGLKTAIKASNWIIEEFMKAMWKLANEFPAQREKCMSETSVFTLPFCWHQLCENQNCAGPTELF